MAVSVLIGVGDTWGDLEGVSGGIPGPAGSFNDDFVAILLSKSPLCENQLEC